MSRRVAAFRRDRRGSAVVEFALVLPVMLVLTMGLGELAYQVYVQAVLTGALQKAGRDAGIEGGAAQADAIDASVKKQLGAVVVLKMFTLVRTNYDNYAAISGEPFTDSDYPVGSGIYDGVCNRGEPYVDVNSNGKYDKKLGNAGQGGADEVVQYTATLAYQRLFPIKLFKWGQTATLSSTTLLKNQPYATQTTNDGTTTGTCP